MTLMLEILVVLYFIFALRYFKLAVILLPLFFPAYLLGLQIFGIPFTFVELLIDAVFLAFLFKLLLRTKPTPDNFRDFCTRVMQPLNREFWLAVLMIVAAALISTLIAPKQLLMADGNTVFYGQRIALGILKGWIMTPVLMMVLFWTVIREKEDMLLLLNAYALSCVLLAVSALWQVVSHNYLTLDARASGPFQSANYLALFITPAILYAAIRLRESFLLLRKEQQWSWLKRLFGFRQKEFWRLALWTFALLLLFLALLFTKSYAAILALGLASVFYFLQNFFKSGHKFSWKFFWLAVAAMSLLLLTIFVLDPKKWLLFFEFYQRTSSAVRIEVYTIAANLILHHPLLGIGLGQFPAVYQLQGPSILGHNPYEWNMPHPHNLFFAFWLNLGLLGFAALLWIIWLSIAKIKPLLRSFAFENGLTRNKIRVMAFAFFLIILVHGFFDTPFFKNDLVLIFWTFLTLTFA